MAYNPKICACLSPKCYGPIDHHHIKTRGAGGKDSDCILLCRAHHSECHNIGRKTFYKKYKHCWTETENRIWERVLRLIKRTF